MKFFYQTKAQIKFLSHQSYFPPEIAKIIGEYASRTNFEKMMNHIEQLSPLPHLEAICNYAEMYNVVCKNYKNTDESNDTIIKIFDLRHHHVMFKIVDNTPVDTKTEMIVFHYIDRGITVWSEFVYRLKKTFPNLKGLCLSQNYTYPDKYTDIFKALSSLSFVYINDWQTHDLHENSYKSLLYQSDPSLFIFTFDKRFKTKKTCVGNKRIIVAKSVT